MWGRVRRPGQADQFQSLSAIALDKVGSICLEMLWPSLSEGGVVAYIGVGFVHRHP